MSNQPLAQTTESKFSVLKNRNFTLMWGGLIISNSGSWMTLVGLGWLVYNLTGSSVAQCHRRARQVVNQPAEADQRHPRAGVRNDEPAPHQREVAVLQDGELALGRLGERLIGHTAQCKYAEQADAA